MPRDMSIFEYLQGAGTDYPSMADLARVLLAAQFSRSEDAADALVDPIKRNVARQRRGKPRPESVDSAPVKVQPASDTRGTGMPGQDYVSPFAPIPSPVVGGTSPDFIKEKVTAPKPPPEQNSWEAFVAMNPGLDYEAVVKQAGGIPGSFPVENEFGGAISEMPDSKDRISDEDYIKSVENENFKFQLSRKMDPRSRSFDPQGAALMIEMKNNELKNKAEMLKAKAWMQDSNNQAAQVAMAQAQRSAPPQADPGEIVEAAEIAIKYGGEQAYPIAMLAISLANQGRVDEAYALLARAGAVPGPDGQVGRDPEAAGPPPGIPSGVEYVAPDGSIKRAP